MKIGILDPGLQDHKGNASVNLGDLIIQDAVKQELTQLFPQAEIVHYSSHAPLTSEQLSNLSSFAAVIVGGSNLLSSRLRPYNRWSEKYERWTNQWAISLIDAIRIKNATLLGAGWVQYQNPPDFFSRMMYRFALSRQTFQSVRDEYSKKRLMEAGISNVLNTNCITMWQLAKKDMRRYPTTQAENALVILTDYAKKPEYDGRLLKLLKNRYKSVYAWPQGSHDKAYLEELGFDGVMLDRSLAGLDDFVRSGNSFDYIGTRLHGGIRCLQNDKRALIIEVDNRATEIARDTNLPTVKREDFDFIEKWIGCSEPLNLRLQTGAQQQWRDRLREIAGVPVVKA